MFLRMEEGCLMCFSKCLQTSATHLVIQTCKEKLKLWILRCLDHSILQQREQMHFDACSVGRCTQAKEILQDISSLSVEKSHSFSAHIVLFEQNTKAVCWPISVANILEINCWSIVCSWNAITESLSKRVLTVPILSSETYLYYQVFLFISLLIKCQFQISGISETLLRCKIKQNFVCFYRLSDCFWIAWT